MGFKGSLESINLADIFQNLAMNQQTGTLKVSDKDRVKCIYFHRGEVRYLSHGKRKNILLGEMLVGRGLATREQVDSALGEQRNSNRLLGDIVVDLEICSREDIDNLVRFQIEEEIYDLFGWERAEFEFTEGAPAQDLFDAEQQATELSINTSSLIMEAARRIDEWERIRHLIPSTSTVFVNNVAEIPADAQPVAARLFMFLNGSRDVDAMVEDSHFSRFEVASTLVAMLEAGHIRLAAVEELAAGAAACVESDQPERAVRLMEQALTMGSTDPNLRQQLADACASLGEKEKSAIHLSVLGDERAAAGDQEGAIAAYERILALLPRHISAHERLAKARASQNETEQALKHYVNLVQALIDAGRLDDATTKCREGLLLDGENIELRSALAKILMSSGNKDGAIEEFERLAEILNRSGQVRPAADIFRRILQIDAGNKHAKRRLNSLLSGAGIKRESHFVRNVSILFFITMLCGAVYIGFHEFTALRQYEEAIKSSRDLLDQEDFAGARGALKPILSNWSIVDHQSAAKQQMGIIDQQERAEQDRQEKSRKVAESEVKDKLQKAKELRGTYEYEPAAKLFAEVAVSAHATPDMKAESATAMKAMDAEQKSVAEFLEWKEKAAKADDLATLKEEFSRTLAIQTRYPRNPQIRDATLPLRIDTVPAASKVYVDRVARGNSPIVVRYPKGRPPQIKVERLGYATVDQVDLPNTVRIEVTLKRAVSWRYDAGTPIISLAAGPEQTLLVANQDGVLSSIDVTGANPGAEQRTSSWIFRTAEPLVGIVSGVSVIGSVAYFGTDSVYALELGAGIRKRWVASVGGRVLAPVTAGKVNLVVFSDYVFGTCVDPRGAGSVWAIDNSKGDIQWRVSPSDSRAPTKAQPLFQGTRLYVPFEDGRVYGIEAANGQVSASWTVGPPASATSLVLEAGLAWLATGDGKLHGIDLSKPGRPAKTFDAGWPVTTQLTVRDGIAYFGDERGNLHAVELQTLTRAWPQFAGNGAVAGSLAITSKRVYFGTTSGWVYALDRSTGRLSWNYRLGNEVRAGVFFEGRYLCVGSGDGYLYGFDELAVPHPE